jgi:hypothetical protein
MGDVRLVAPRVQVIREGADPLEVQTDNRDLLAWEATRVRHKWPKFDESPFRWMTFLAWSAARRSGALENGTTYEQWEQSVLSVRDTSSDEDDLGRPTDPGPATG